MTARGGNLTASHQPITGSQPANQPARSPFILGASCWVVTSESSFPGNTVTTAGGLPTLAKATTTITEGCAWHRDRKVKCPISFWGHNSTNCVFSSLHSYKLLKKLSLRAKQLSRRLTSGRCGVGFVREEGMIRFLKRKSFLVLHYVKWKFWKYWYLVGLLTLKQNTLWICHRKHKKMRSGNKEKTIQWINFGFCFQNHNRNSWGFALNMGHLCYTRQTCFSAWALPHLLTLLWH